MPGYDGVYGTLEDPITIMKRGYRIAMLIGLFGFFFICHQFLNPAFHKDAWIMFGLCGVIGMLVAYLFIEVTQYYTDYKYAPV